MNKNNENGFFKGLFLGAIIGAGAYYFLTSTKEGKKIKTKIALKTDEALGDLTETITDFEKKAEKFKNMALDVQKDLNEKARFVEGEAKEEIKKKIQEISDLKSRGKQASKVFFTKNGKSLSKK
jgi:gas vesicle protein